MDRTDVIEKVRACYRLANDPGATEGEKAAAEEAAAKLMAKYAIDDIVLQESGKGAKDNIVVGNIRITRDDKPGKVKNQRQALAWVVAKNNRCKGILIHLYETVDVDTGKVVPGGEFIQVVGYSHDVEFVRDLFNGLALDMGMAMADEASHADNYLKNFALGYVDRIDQRLRMAARETVKVAEGVGSSTALVLVSRSEAVEVKVKELYPNLTTVRAPSFKVDPNARERGRKAADRADIGQDKVGTGRAGELKS